MKFDKKFLVFLLITLFSHLLVFYLKNYIAITKTVDGVEQENFLQYAYYLKLGGVPERIGFFFTRLFPGVSVIILLLSYISNDPITLAVIFFVIFLSILYFLSYKITKDAFFSFWVTIFPPVVFEITSKITTEIVMINLILIIYLLFFKYHRILTAVLVTSFSMIIRPIGVMIFAALFIQEIRNKLRYSETVKLLLVFSVFPILLVIYNLYYFDHPFYQIYVYQETIGSTLVIPFLLRIWKDWFIQGNFRVLGSFLIYTVVAVALVVYVLRSKKDFLYESDQLFVKLWSLFTLLFILGIGPKVFIAAGGRFYSVIYTPVFIFLYKKVGAHRRLLYLLMPSIIFAFI